MYNARPVKKLPTPKAANRDFLHFRKPDNWLQAPRTPSGKTWHENSGTHCSRLIRRHLAAYSNQSSWNSVWVGVRDRIIGFEKRGVYIDRSGAGIRNIANQIWRLVIRGGQAACCNKGQPDPVFSEQATKLLASKRAQLDTLGPKFSTNRRELDSLITQASDFEWSRQERNIAKGRPGDIVNDDYSEASRDILVTAKMIRAASRARDKYLQKLLG